ncbi:MAG: helix-turn-helix domain-containing protein [bacterium]|nr:helix-turn-helix domain-containing protein [bacterium]
MTQIEPAVLEQAGLSREEGAVYLALLVGDATVAEIARRAKLHRPQVYQLLGTLAERGLVTPLTKGKRTHYAASAPARLHELFVERAQAFERAVTALEQQHAASGVAPSVRVLTGAKGLRSVLEDLTAKLPNGGIFYRYSSRSPRLDAERFVPKEYRAKRTAAKIEQFVITNAALRTAPHQRRIECYSKMVPKGDDPFEYNVALLVYGNTVATVDYEGEIALIIENERIARFHERIFRLLFERL